jgi:hypothetical protein
MMRLTFLGQVRVTVIALVWLCPLLGACGGRASPGPLGEERTGSSSEERGGSSEDDPSRLPGTPGQTSVLSACKGSCDDAVDCEVYSDLDVADCKKSCEEATDFAEEEGCFSDWEAFMLCAADEVDCGGIGLRCPTETDAYVICINDL